MGAKVRGLVHLYGITGSIASATVQSVKLKSEAQNTAETTDAFGNEIERRIDDIKDEGTVELKMQAAYAIPSVGDTLVYETLSYEITSVDRAEVSKGHRMLTLGLRKTQYVAGGTFTSVTTTASS